MDVFLPLMYYLYMRTKIGEKKHPEMSPYVMCADNPVNYVDKDRKKPTKEEAARMAAHVYGDNSDKILSGEWIKSARNFGVKLQRSSGLCSAVYERTVKGKTIVVHATAGTQDWKDIKEDVKQIVGVSKQYAEPVENAKEISKILGGNTKLNFVGHSLGGGEAALNSLVTSKDNLKGREAITFNAAYVTNLTKIANGHWYTPFKSENRITA